MSYIGVGIGVLLISVHRIYKQRKRSKELNKLRGGLNFEEYIDPDLMYEIKDQQVAADIRKFIRKHFGLLISRNTPLVIDSKLAILIVRTVQDYIVRKKLHFFIKRLPIPMFSAVLSILAEGNFYGIAFIGPSINTIRAIFYTIVPLIGGTLTLTAAHLVLLPAVFQILGVPAMAYGMNLVAATTIALGAISSNGYATILKNTQDRLDRQVYEQLVSPIKRELVTISSADGSSKTVGQFALPEKTQDSTGVYIRSEDDEKYSIPCQVKEVDVFVPIRTQTDAAVCESVENERVCRSKTVRKFVPLKQRTKTWAQLLEQNPPPKTSSLREIIRNENLFDSYNQKVEHRQRRCELNDIDNNDYIDNIDNFIDEMNQWE